MDRVPELNTCTRRGVRLGAVLAMVLILTGCDRVASWIEEKLNEGTQLGVKACIERNADSGLDSDFVTRKCREKHEARVFVDMTGGAEYRIYGNGGATSFGGELENRGDGVVVTRVLLLVHPNLDDPSETETLAVDNIWILPGRKIEFSVSDLDSRPTVRGIRTQTASMRC